MIFVMTEIYSSVNCFKQMENWSLLGKAYDLETVR